MIRWIVFAISLADLVVIGAVNDHETNTPSMAVPNYRAMIDATPADQTPQAILFQRIFDHFVRLKRKGSLTADIIIDSPEPVEDQHLRSHRASKQRGERESPVPEVTWHEKKKREEEHTLQRSLSVVNFSSLTKAELETAITEEFKAHFKMTPIYVPWWPSRTEFIKINCGLSIIIAQTLLSLFLLFLVEHRTRQM